MAKSDQIARPAHSKNSRSALVREFYSRLRASVDPQIAGLLICLAGLIVGFSFSSPYFLSLQNLTNMLLSVSVIGTMAGVSALVLVSRGLDLSVGSIVGLVGVVVALVIEATSSAPLGIAVGLVTGGVCGILNAALFVNVGINSIIVTIGTLSIFRGLAFVISEGQTVNVFNEFMLELGAGRIYGIPYSVLLMLVLFVILHVVATHTRVGRTLYAIGANPRASRLSGLNIGIYRYGVFVMNGIFAGVAGILLIGQAATAVPAAGIGYELLVVTAVLLGGTSLHGGEGRIAGTLLGVIIIGVLSNGMTLIGINSYYQIIAHGTLLLLAVALDRLRQGLPKDE
ncbi:MAG: ABC transporter permease [Bradyrhizobiaceae bacterium]|nr:ABC transporter permease [Bradyrhizobiaceae bacterium]